MNGAEKGVLISGVGGQGIVFAGRLLARAWFGQGKHVALRHAYGAEVMGTAVHSEVVVAEGPIRCPYLETADVAVVLHRAAVGEVLPRLAPGALLVLDGEIELRAPPDDLRAEVRPLIRTAEASASGDPGRAAPLLALGFLAGRGVVDLDGLIAAIGTGATADEATRMLRIGYSLA